MYSNKMVEIVKIVKEVSCKINQEVQSCNKRGAKDNNRFFEPFVFLSQEAADRILADQKHSLLERIILCNKEINRYGAGNCQLQTFVALEELIKHFVLSGLSDYDRCIPISIFLTTDHAFLLVDDQLVCDPWINYVGPIQGSPIKLSTRKEFFAIRSNWLCSESGRLDRESSEYTFELFEHLRRENKNNLPYAESASAQNIIELDLSDNPWSSIFNNENEVESEIPTPTQGRH